MLIITKAGTGSHEHQTKGGEKERTERGPHPKLNKNDLGKGDQLLCQEGEGKQS